MRTKIPHLLIVALLAIAATFCLATSAAAQLNPALDSKVEASHQVVEQNDVQTKTFSRRGGGQAKSAFPNFDEVPHGRPLLAHFYDHSYWGRDGQLIDVYIILGVPITGPTGYFQ